MLGLIHPLDGKLYEKDGKGNVRVSKDGVWGLFDTEGRHLEGEMFESDPQMCGWVGGPKYTNARLDKSADRT